MTKEVVHNMGCYILSCSMLVFTACSSTYPIVPPSSQRSSDELGYTEVNQRIKGDSVRVEMKNGTVYKVPQFQFGNDSSVIAIEGRWTPLIVDNQAISSIGTVNHSLGASQGFLLGIFGGGIVGAVVTPSPNKSESGARYWTATLSIAAFALLGGVVGLIIGAAKGIKNNYPIQQEGKAVK